MNGPLAYSVGRPMPKTICFALLLALAGCAQKSQQDSISADSLLGEIKTLSSDEFEGRKPGSPGEVKTIAYMEQQFRAMGKAG